MADDGFAIVTDDPVPHVQPDEKLSGGAYTVQSQSIEPFAAFATGRLGVRRPDPFETGISSKVRGNLVHEALRNLFSDCPSRQDLAEWNDEERQQQLGSAVDTALAGPLRHVDRTHQRLLGFERSRLVRLLADFLVAEVSRPDFRIAAVEKKVDYRACGVQLELRIDRLDRLADGTVLLIDYKTGRPRTLLSKEGEPKDLQLIVYADALDEPVGGMALVNVDRPSITYSGAGAGTDWDPIADDEWANWLTTWRDEVRALLCEMSAGDARINLHLSSNEGRALNILSRFEERRRA